MINQGSYSPIPKFQKISCKDKNTWKIKRTKGRKLLWKH